MIHFLGVVTTLAFLHISTAHCLIHYHSMGSLQQPAHAMGSGRQFRIVCIFLDSKCFSPLSVVKAAVSLRAGMGDHHGSQKQLQRRRNACVSKHCRPINWTHSVSFTIPEATLGHGIGLKKKSIHPDSKHWQRQVNGSIIN